jgi:HAD superfamily hydrolase (TIGR01549 family)
MADTAIFDVDGTLVDSNYQHALAWYRALRSKDITVPLWRLHRGIGMGGDTFVPSVVSDEVEARYGDELRELWVGEFDKLIDEIQPFEEARQLLEDVKGRGFKLVLASSGKSQHVDHFLNLLDAKSVADEWTTSEDAEHSKPEPDLLETALAKVEGARGVMVGDSTWDFVAAEKLGVPALAVRTGGFSPEELLEAGALKVFESLAEMRKGLDDTALSRPD